MTDTAISANDPKTTARRIELDGDLSSIVLAAGASNFNSRNLTEAVEALCRHAIRLLSGQSSQDGADGNDKTCQ